tara:strand:+ start:656 stop:1402 length:747 start_codon:yes stop_codon:yes gene_type:complete
MANISSYPIITPKPSDLVLVVQTYLAGVSTETGNPTKTARVSDFLSLGVQSLTTVGTSGAATLNAGVLNIPTPSVSSSPFTFNASSTTGIESQSNTASGNYSTAMGNFTTASGYRSTAMGSSTTASGESSTSMGHGTTAKGYRSTAMGQYNVLNSGDAATSFNLTNTAFSIGNGTSAGARSDAFSVLFNGNTTVAGSITSASLNIAVLNAAPASASATGTIGEIKFTADHIYVCVNNNTWKRVAIATF